MSSISVEIEFEGLATEGGVIDANVLAKSLSGYSELFRRSDQIVNGEASQAAVLVRSHFRPGSFIADVQFVQNVLEGAKHFITAHTFVDAGGLAALIGIAFKDSIQESLIELYKWLRGAKPEKSVRIGGNVELTLGQSKKTVNNYVFNLYGDSEIRAALGKLTSPLKETNIDRISMKRDGAEQNSINKAEKEFFEIEPLALETDAAPSEGERDTTLVVAKLSFSERNNWTFYERGATVIAKIEDKRFWSEIHQHNLTFGEGDRLRVRLAWKIEKKDRLIQKNTISKVHEVIPQDRQLEFEE